MDRAPTDPRWGDACRDVKARAIAGTLARAVGSELPRGAWLDIGCGSGELAAELARVVGPSAMFGVDPEPWERWRELADGTGALRFLQGGCEDLTALIGDAAVDVVVCNQVYEHVPSAQALLRGIHAVLRPGGVCYFAGPNLLWPIEPHVFWPFVHWLPRNFAQATMRALGSRRADELDAHSLDWWRLTGLIREAGFIRRDALRHRLAEVAGPSPVARACRLAARLPQVLFEVLAPLSPGFVFVLRKPVT